VFLKSWLRDKTVAHYIKSSLNSKIVIHNFISYDARSAGLYKAKCVVFLTYVFRCVISFITENSEKKINTEGRWHSE